MKQQTSPKSPAPDGGPVVALTLAQVLAPRSVDGPPRATRKRPPR